MTAPLTAADRSKLRRILIRSGQATRGLDDNALIAAAGKLDPVVPSLPTTPTKLDDPEPEPTRQRRKRKPAKPDPAPIDIDGTAPTVTDKRVAPPAAPQPPAGDEIATAITHAIQSALASEKVIA